MAEEPNSGRVVAPDAPFAHEEMPEEAATEGSEELLGGPPEGMQAVGGHLVDRTSQDDPEAEARQQARGTAVKDPEPPGSKLGERQRERQRERRKQKDAPKLSESEAASALDLMLSTDAPPLPESRFNMEDLAARLKKMELPVPEDEEGVAQFIIELRGLSERELADLDERARRPPTAQEREEGMSGRVRDQNRYFRLIVVESMIEPDLSNERLLSEHGPTAEHVVMRWFLPGEITFIAQRVMQLSGWSDNALVAAKN